MVTEQNIQQFSEQCKNIFEQIGRDVIGQKEVIEGAVIAMIAGTEYCIKSLRMRSVPSSKAAVLTSDIPIYWKIGGGVPPISQSIMNSKC